MNLEDTARKLDEGIRALLDARDGLYQVDRMAEVLSAPQNRALLITYQQRVRAAAAEIGEIEIADATPTPAETH